MPEPVRYDVWSALLADIVTPEGKVDYARLAEHRGLLERVVAELGAASPESDPGRFPSEEDRLAYWLNAYNAFTLHAIIAEYPITSVWKTRDGQFFQRRRHVAGGRAVTTRESRGGVLRLVARHTGLPFERIADYEVVYNVYDWGLNDAARTPHLGPILFHEPVEHFAEGDTELRELHLYEGNFCNRT